MARFEFKLPDIGEGVAEGEIISWLVRPGDPIDEDQPMVEVMTDKATVTIGSPKRGRVLETIGREGDVVPVHSVLVVLETENENDAAAPTASTASAVGEIRESLPGMSLGAHHARDPQTAQPVASVGAYFSEKPLATPATRRLARDLGLDLRAVPPSGEGGRVTHEDVRKADHRSRSPAPVPIASGTCDEAQLSDRVPVRTPSVHRAPSRIPLKGLRRRIFENTARSKSTLAHFTFVEECDVGSLISLREKLKAPALLRGLKLSYLPFVVKAVVIALKRHSTLNTSFDDKTQEIVVHREFHIGIATATDAGLTVPVVKHADQLNLIEIGQEIDRISTDARQGKSRIEDVQGATFTITSLGQKGGLLATPVIHYPEAAILGLHQIKRRPVVRGEQIVIGDIMLISLSFDHRLIDGHVGASFAYEVIGLLEHPEELLLSSG